MNVRQLLVALAGMNDLESEVRIKVGSNDATDIVSIEPAMDEDSSEEVVTISDQPA